MKLFTVGLWAASGAVLLATAPAVWAGLLVLALAFALALELEP